MASSNRESRRALTFYCDESGHTGADWADTDQRIFVHGGWLVPNPQREILSAELAQTRRQFHIQSTELKWSSISRRRDSASVFRSVFDSMVKSQCLPFFVVAEKRYLIAAKLVETIFDPEYNPNLPRGFTGDFHTKKQLAETLLLSLPILAQFAAWHRKGVAPGEDEFRTLIRDTARHLSTLGLQSGARSLRGIPSEGIAEMRDEIGLPNWNRTATSHTIWNVLRMLDEHASNEGSRIEVVHDNLVRFDDLIDLVQGASARPQGPIANIQGISLANSASTPLVQAADLLCGFVRSMFSKLLSDSSLSEGERLLAQDLAVLHDQQFTWDYNASRELMNTFSLAVFR